MKKPHLVAALALTTSLYADDRGERIFFDDFERDESQETTDEVGNGWGTNSKSRAGGNKQVDLRDGAMHISMHESADHAVSVTHPAKFQDGSVELRFMLVGEEDSLGLDFADLAYKEVHAGHLFKVTVYQDSITIDDMKTGGMNLKFRELKKANTLSEEQKRFLATTKKRFPAKVAPGEWHGLQVTVSGDTVSVTIDGKDAGTFRSDGFAHPNKRLLRLGVPRRAVVDDVAIYARSAGS